MIFSVSGSEPGIEFRRHNPAVTAPVRREMARVCGLLKPRFLTEFPEDVSHVRLLLNRAIRVMQFAASNCMMADVKIEIAPVEYRLLTALKFADPNQVESVEFFARHPDLLGAEDEPTKEAWLAGDAVKATGRHYLNYVRGSLRINVSPRNTLEILAERGWIQEMAARGEVSFFIGLGETLAEAGRRQQSGSYRLPNTQAILHVWIPLNLAICRADGAEAWGKFQQYCTAMMQPGMTETEFLTAWRNIRNRQLKHLISKLRANDRAGGARRKASASSKTRRCQL